MSEALLVRRGGGSTKLFAAIGVSYPEGSACTCTDGVKSFAAKDTSGKWIFPIPYAGTWTVTATDGNKTATQTVEITTNGQNAVVELSYELILADNSVALVDITNKDFGGIQEDGFLWIEKGGNSGGFFTTNKIDVTRYATLSLTAENTISEPDVFRLGLSDTTDTFYNIAQASHPEVGMGTYTLSLDISGITGSYHVCAISWHSFIKVIKLWLE